MKFLKLVIVAMFIAISGAFAFDANKKEIIIGTSAMRPPVSFVNDKNEIVGFDPEFVRAVMAELGYTVKFENMDFDALIPSLVSGKIDLIASGLSINDERKKKIDYSVPYNTMGSRIVVLKNNTSINGFKDLKNKTLGVEVGTIQYDLIESRKNEIGKIVGYKNGELFLALSTGKVDAVIENSVMTGYFMKNKSKGIKEIKMVGELLIPTDMGYGIAKGNNDFIKKLNASIEKLKQNGRYEEIKNKYF
jgi:polar amino acid transport system substrate-binding protein